MMGAKDIVRNTEGGRFWLYMMVAKIANLNDFNRKMKNLGGGYII